MSGAQVDERMGEAVAESDRQAKLRIVPLSVLEAVVDEYIAAAL
jgi:hypothetical protein